MRYWLDTNKAREEADLLLGMTSKNGKCKGEYGDSGCARTTNEVV
jgi:hypothetical protein